jgi:hypothetical protein
MCVVFTHPFGWELRVTMDGELVRFEVSRESDPTITAAIEWRVAFGAKGRKWCSGSAATPKARRKMTAERKRFK